MIGEDNEFEIDLKRAVVVDLLKKTLFKEHIKLLGLLEPEDLKKLFEEAEVLGAIRQTLDTKIDNLMDSRFYNLYRFNNETRNKIDSAVNEELQKTEKLVLDSVKAKVNEVTEELLPNLDDLIGKRVNEIQEKMINQEVDKRFRKKWLAFQNKMNEGLTDIE